MGNIFEYNSFVILLLFFKIFYLIVSLIECIKVYFGKYLFLKYFNFKYEFLNCFDLID